jgi:hypothetical protein
MTGHRSFKELTKGFSAEHRARMETLVSQLKTDMALHELRRACERSQEHLARALVWGNPPRRLDLNGAQICMSAICDAM